MLHLGWPSPFSKGVRIGGCTRFLSRDNFVGQGDDFIVDLSAIPVHVSLPVVAGLCFSGSGLSSTVLGVSRPPDFSRVGPTAFFTRPCLLTCVVRASVFCLLGEVWGRCFDSRRVLSFSLATSCVRGEIIATRGVETSRLGVFFVGSV